MARAMAQGADILLLDEPFSGVDAATDLDLRLSWQATENLELSVVGQNLFESQRQDYGIAPLRIAAPIGSVERSVYGQVTFRF